ncbi:hypothetical protein K435DRAFT_811685 [Dendrothele bispora CBS 962.96]|uniref:Uncharacterized protein n=1 Tax=Dendrothele bispora (strain CBS 962.96) TaxID=1314807 RepID=A0A4S8KR94_DENBC|nr:hypothetical protein K435DRAFT_811685 [Dendrothele bispora CBS 962.96]
MSRLVFGLGVAKDSQPFCMIKLDEERIRFTNNDWNVMKMHKLTDSLFVKLNHAKATVQRKLSHYKAMSKHNGQHRVEAWLRLSTEPVWNGKEVESVLGQGKVLRDLLECEINDNQALDLRSNAPIALFINRGMKFQAQQRTVENLLRRPDQTPTETSEASRQQVSLRIAIDKWRVEQQQQCPSLMDLVVDQDFSQPETETLYLPSDLSEEQWETHGLRRLANVEMRLR